MTTPINPLLVCLAIAVTAVTLLATSTARRGVLYGLAVGSALFVAPTAAALTTSYTTTAATVLLGLAALIRIGVAVTVDDGPASTFLTAGAASMAVIMATTAMIPLVHSALAGPGLVPVAPRIIAICILLRAATGPSDDDYA